MIDKCCQILQFLVHELFCGCMLLKMKFINIYSGMPNTKQIDLLYIMEELQDILDGK
jgi:hypothetical protein